MKPTSYIFLVVAIIISCIGLIICQTAKKKAEAEGIEIFSQTLDENNNSVYTFPFGEGEIYDKINLTLGDADVNIVGGYTEPYIEIVNIREGSYMMTTSNRIISIDTTIDIKSILMFWESGYTFNGFRNYVHRINDEEKINLKQVNIYLPADTTVHSIDIKIENGDVSVTNLNADIDLMVDIRRGDAEFSSFTTSSGVTAAVDVGNVYLYETTLNSFDATIYTAGDVTTRAFTFNRVNVIGKNTSVNIDSTNELLLYDINLSAVNGMVIIDGEEKGGTYYYDSSDPSGRSVTVTTSGGDITMTKSDYIPLNDIGTDTDTESDTESGADTGEAEE